MTDRRTRIAAALRAARKQQGWSQPRLLSQMRAMATRQGLTLAKDESMLRLMTRWENADAEPDDFHSDLLSRALDLPLAALGFDDQTPAADLASGELCCECDDAALTYRGGRYHLRMSKQLTNSSNRVVTRFLVRVSIDRYPHDPVKSNAHHRDNPLTVEELDLHA